MTLAVEGRGIGDQIGEACGMMIQQGMTQLRRRSGCIADNAIRIEILGLAHTEVQGFETSRTAGTFPGAASSLEPPPQPVSSVIEVRSSRKYFVMRSGVVFLRRVFQQYSRERKINLLQRLP